VFGDVTNVPQDALPPAGKSQKVVSSSGPVESQHRQSPLRHGRLREMIPDMLEEAAASDDVLAHMRSVESLLWRSKDLSEELKVEDLNVEAANALRQASPSRNFVAWMLGHFVEHLELPEEKWLHCMLVFDLYCHHRPEVPESSRLPAVCAAIARLIKKFDDQEPKESIASLPAKASGIAQWMQQSTCPHFDCWVSPDVLNEQENDLLLALRWNIKVFTVQDWMRLLEARLNVFTCNGLKHLLSPVVQHSFVYARLLAAHFATTAKNNGPRVARGLLCLNLIAARVLPADTFDLEELATPMCPATSATPKQCKPESLEFLLDGLQDASGADLETLKADTHMINATLLMLKANS